jgi:hypothetical protein
MTNFYSLPKLIWFKKEGAEVNFEEFRTKIFEFLKLNFPEYTMQTEYGTIHYMSPDKDNQFQEGYLRDVFYTCNFINHFTATLQFHTEESPDDTFNTTYIYNFYSFHFYFKQGCNWTWVKECWGKLKPFLGQQGFYDATFSFTYSGGLYEAMRLIGETEAMDEICRITEEEIIQKFMENPHVAYIEIQEKYFLNLNKILSKHPNKLNVTQIQINTNKLHKLPDALFEFTNLETLYIYNNHLKEVDPRLANLKSLRSVSAHGNGLDREKLKAILPEECEVNL